MDAEDIISALRERYRSPESYEDSGYSIYRDWHGAREKVRFWTRYKSPGLLVVEQEGLNRYIVEGNRVRVVTSVDQEAEFPVDIFFMGYSGSSSLHSIVPPLLYAPWKGLSSIDSREPYVLLPQRRENRFDLMTRYSGKRLTVKADDFTIASFSVLAPETIFEQVSRTQHEFHYESVRFNHLDSIELNFEGFDRRAGCRLLSNMKERIIQDLIKPFHFL